MPPKKIPNLIALPPLRIKYKDVFDAKNFYETLREWVTEYEWKACSGGEAIETYYGERIGRSGAKEVWIRWRLFKKAGDAPLTYYLDIDFHGIAITPTELIIDNKKVKADKGELELAIRAYLEENYKTQMAKSSLLKSFLDLFAKRMYRKTVEERKKELNQEMYVLQNLIKQWFKLKRYLPYEEVAHFHPSTAYPAHVKR